MKLVRDKEFYRTILKLSIPAALQSMIGYLVVVADDMMVSAMPNGVEAQAGVSQINSLTAFFTATVLGFVSGSSVLIAQYWGKKDTERIKRVFAIVTLVSVIIAGIFIALSLTIPEKVVSLVVTKSETGVTEQSLKYLQIVCFSYLPYALCYALVGMLRAVEVVKMTLYITISSLIVNISLNYVLINGYLGFPPMGVRGAAIATLIARIVELAIVWWYAFKRQKAIDIKPADLFKYDKLMAKDYMKYGAPVGFTDAQWSLIGVFKAAIIGQLTKEFMSANSITNSAMNLGMMFTFALAGGACVVVGKAVGAGDYAKARQYSNTIQVMFAIIGVIMAGVVILLARPFVSLYGSASDPEVRKLTITMITIGAFTMIGTSYHASCFVGINRGAGDSRFVAMVDMICGWLIVLPATFLSAIVFHAPLPIVFLMTRIDQCFKWIIAFIRLRGDKWIKNVTRT